MTIDKYTKVILTLIAVGVLGLNFHLYSGSLIKEAKAEVGFFDLIMVKDEIIERIALAEIRLQYLIEGYHN